jgi:hypothetical protein
MTNLSMAIEKAYFKLPVLAMSNVTKTMTMTKSLDELLDALGFDTFKIVMSTFVMSLINILGTLFCSLSAWIFFHRRFHHPIFFYYRLLCIVYIFHLVSNIPRGVFFSPRYFPNMNTYPNAWYQVVYAGCSATLFHFEETLQIGILMTKIKLFSSFVTHNFSASPQSVSVSFFLICFCINLPYAVLAFKVSSLGTYFYYDSNGSMQNTTLFFIVSSDFSTTPFGRGLLTFTSIFANLFLSLVVGVVLNIVSVYLYKSYLKQRRIRDEAFRVAWVFNQTGTSAELVVSSALPTPELTLKERNERKTERNMFFMALTLSSISVLSRVIFVVSYVYFFFFSFIPNNLLVMVINYTMYTLTPTVAIFVFYRFNKAFRQELKEKLFKKETNQKNKVSSPT